MRGVISVVSGFSRTSRGRASKFPVVIGAGPHPFPFRTRKLSLLPSMVLCGKLHGRVDRCREYYQKKPSVEKSRWAFCFLAPKNTCHATNHASGCVSSQGRKCDQIVSPVTRICPASHLRPNITISSLSALNLCSCRWQTRR